MGTAAARMHDPALQCCAAAAPAACRCGAPPPQLCPFPLPRCVPQALKEGQRIDGRTPLELRAARFQFALDDSSCTVLLGRTRVMAVVAATLEAPFADRHNEGSLRFNVEFSPMASPAFESGAAVCGCLWCLWRVACGWGSTAEGGGGAGALAGGGV